MAIQTDSLLVAGGGEALKSISNSKFKLNIGAGKHAAAMIPCEMPYRGFVFIDATTANACNSPAAMFVSAPKPSAAYMTYGAEQTTALLVASGPSFLVYDETGNPVTVTIMGACTSLTINGGTISGLFIGQHIYIPNGNRQHIILDTHAQVLAAPTGDNNALSLMGDFKLTSSCNIRDKNGNYIVRNGERVDS